MRRASFFRDAVASFTNTRRQFLAQIELRCTSADASKLEENTWRVHRALRGRSIEAGVHAILKDVVHPERPRCAGDSIDGRRMAHRADGGRDCWILAARCVRRTALQYRMILVDANVVSEPPRAVPESRVADWLDAQTLETFCLSAITVAELRFGVRLPVGRRRDRLRNDLEGQVLPMFAGRVLAFNLVASQACSELMARARSAGLANSISDGYIAATATASGVMVATRGIAPLRAAGLETIDTWAA